MPAVVKHLHIVSKASLLRVVPTNFLILDLTPRLILGLSVSKYEIDDI